MIPSRFRRGAGIAALVMVSAFPTLPLTAQTQAATTLYGTVFNASGEPLSEVEIALDGGEVVAWTSRAGEFRFRGPAAGTHVVSFTKDGFVPRSFRFTLPADTLPEIDIGAVLLDPALPAGSTPTLTGTVTDATSGEGVPAVLVTLDSSIAVMTNVQGEFRIANVAAGSHVVEIRRIGYQQVRATVNLPPGGAGADLDVELQAIPYQLPEVVVQGDRTTYAFGRLRGFYERMRTGFGYFITQADIEKRAPRVVTDLMFGVPGLTVTPGPLGQNSIRLSSGNPSCRGPVVFLDNIQLQGVDLDQVLNPTDIAGIEVYTRTSEIPSQFATRGGACGVIAVWTR